MKPWAVTVDTGLAVGIIDIDVMAEDSEDARSKALEICYAKYKAEYEKSAKAAVRHKAKMRKLKESNAKNSY